MENPKHAISFEDAKAYSKWTSHSYSSYVAGKLSSDNNEKNWRTLHHVDFCISQDSGSETKRIQENQITYIKDPENPC